MSSAKRTLRQVIKAWVAGTGPAPRILRRCDACGEEGWRPLERGIRAVEVNTRLLDGRRADLACRDLQGRARLVIQLAGPSRLLNRSETAAGGPLVVLDARALREDPLHWRPVREQGLPKWRCRCAHARALPVDDAFSLRVIGCPLNVRRAGSESYASVVHDCARCGFFVGIGYSNPERRRVSLYCSFGASLRRRVGRAPVRAPGGPAPVEIAARTAVRS
jgi:hypothetical protein